jgi:hypothetical protein
MNEEKLMPYFISIFYFLFFLKKGNAEVVDRLFHQNALDVDLLKFNEIVQTPMLCLQWHDTLLNDT